MATLRLCSIPDCGKPYLAGGFCSAHYTRVRRYGDPQVLRNLTPGQTLDFYYREVLTYEGDECLIWPHGRTKSGYGITTLNGRHAYIHRMACEEQNGPPPTPEHEAAHSCGRGHLGCVTKRHLLWKTPLENSADRHTHGTQPHGETHHSATLTEKQVRDILSLKGQMLQSQIAEQFGVSKSLISAIYRRKAWKHL